MRRLLPLVLLFTAACQNVTESPEIPETVLAALDSASVRPHIEILSDDAMEGRGTGQPGEARAVAYIAEQMEAAGLEPAGDDGTWFQEVPLLGSTPEPQGPLAFVHESGNEILLDFVDDFIVSTDLEDTRVAVNAPLVFVGYGIEAPGYDWSSYKDVNVTDKIIVSFVNDPPANETEPNLFQADTLTYYGRWTYKYEEARRKGARGAILIHTTPTASYPFQVLSATAAGEQIQLATPPENPLALKSWITEESARALAEMSGSTLEAWFEAAGGRDFQPMELPVSAAVQVDYAVRRFSGQNVVGKITGAVRPDESVVFSAHHDHLGIGKPDASGDTIYNGAVDNASGVGMLLSLGKAMSASPEPPERSLVFLSVSAEESGLLGAEFYARNPHLPLALAAGNINVDSGNVYGRTHDIVGIGAEKSEMMGLFREAAEAEGLRVEPDPNPNAGSFFRSDQLAFARGGVPAVFVVTGKDYQGRPEGWGLENRADYTANRYHQPSDEFDPSWPMGGVVQQMRVAARVAYRLGWSDLELQWNEGEAFGEAR
ncbi:MAG: M28 family peptidase [Rhodothermales bacterium]|nr:M28 family peptidase [Rhodothermales bacterium]MBO6778113.1 M28 family peptidase [Rhodothermales bacterium]